MSEYTTRISAEVRLHNRRIAAATFDGEGLEGNVFLQFCRVTDRDGDYTLEHERAATVRDDGRRLVTVRLSAEGAAATIKVLSKMLREMAKPYEGPRRFGVDLRRKP